MSQDNLKEKSTRIKARPRAIALVGPHGGGKTSLLESIAAVTAIAQGAVACPAWAIMRPKPAPAR